MNKVRLTVRIDFGSADRAVGPGKIRLLEAIERTGSISQAGRSLGMSYRRAWLLVDELCRLFREPVVITQPGGARGGGAALTPFGRMLIGKYRAIEKAATAKAESHLRDLETSLRNGIVRRQKPLPSRAKPDGRRTAKKR